MFSHIRCTLLFVIITLCVPIIDTHSFHGHHSCFDCDFSYQNLQVSLNNTQLIFYTKQMSLLSDFNKNIDASTHFLFINLLPRDSGR